MSKEQKNVRLRPRGHISQYRGWHIVHPSHSQGGGPGNWWAYRPNRDPVGGKGYNANPDLSGYETARDIIAAIDAIEG